MKSRAPRGSTILTALGATIVLVLIVTGVLAYTGSEQERSSRSVRELDAQDCAESGAQYGRKWYGDHFDQWNNYLKTPNPSGELPRNNPESTKQTEYPNWGEGSFGRMDGLPVDGSHLPDFRVTIADNLDELPPDAPNPYQDNDMQIIMRSECINPRLIALAPGTSTVPAAPVVKDDPYGWHGNKVLADSSQTRRDKVISVTLIHVPSNQYNEQLNGGAGGDQNVYQQ